MIYVKIYFIMIKKKIVCKPYQFKFTVFVLDLEEDKSHEFYGMLYSREEDGFYSERCAITIRSHPSGDHGIVFNAIDNRFNLHVIVHELSHIIDSMGEFIGQDFTDEHRAYWMEHLFNEVYNNVWLPLRERYIKEGK